MNPPRNTLAVALSVIYISSASTLFSGFLNWYTCTKPKMENSTSCDTTMPCTKSGGFRANLDCGCRVLCQLLSRLKKWIKLFG